jgi:hypothetical protein
MVAVVPLVKLLLEGVKVAVIVVEPALSKLSVLPLTIVATVVSLEA